MTPEAICINTDTNISQIIKNLRAETGLTQQELSEILGVRKTTISNYEIGYSTPSKKVISQLISRFDIPAETFFGADGSKYNEGFNMINKKFGQPLFVTSIPFFTNLNVEGILRKSVSLCNSLISLPKNILSSKGSYIASEMPDNSMNMCGIKRGACIIVATDGKPKDNDITAVIYNNQLTVRRYRKIDEEEFLLAQSSKIPPSRSRFNLPDISFIIIGKVVKIISDTYGM